MGHHDRAPGKTGQNRCQRCLKPCLYWQVFCGAACSARWEAGDRSPPPSSEEK